MNIIMRKKIYKEKKKSQKKMIKKLKDYYKFWIDLLIQIQYMLN